MDDREFANNLILASIKKQSSNLPWDGMEKEKRISLYENWYDEWAARNYYYNHFKIHRFGNPLLIPEVEL